MKNFNNLYKDYLIKFEKQKEKALLRGDPIFDAEALNKVEFEAMFKAAQNDMRNEGRTITDKKTTDFLIDRQVYSRSLKQGIALQKAAAKRGIEMTVHQARVWGGLDDMSGAPANVQTFWNEIRTTQDRLREQGYSSNEVAKFIAIEFFGSPS